MSEELGQTCVGQMDAALFEKYKLNPTEVLYGEAKEALPRIRDDKYYAVTMWVGDDPSSLGKVWTVGGKTGGNREVKAKKVSKSDQKTP